MTKSTKKHALLVQAHQDIGYFIALAARQPTINIYVHIDAKSTYLPLAASAPVSNLYLLDDRVPVYWGGFSQIRASLKLFEVAFANADNAYFHLVSGEDVVLQDFAKIEQTWQNDVNFAVMMTCTHAPQYKYRFVTNSVQADTAWQRKLPGKVMTKLQQGLAKVLPFHQSIYFGSQWFSITREDWQQVLPYLDEYCDFFEQKLVPDEHFFQTLISEQLANQLCLVNDNKRLIMFDKAVNNGNSPLYLTLLQLERAKFDGYWFARKVKADTARQWLTGETA